MQEKHHGSIYSLMVNNTGYSTHAESNINPFLRSLDPLNPLVEIHNNFIFGAQYSDVLIPCKPTAMHVQVRLLKEGDEVRNGFCFIKIIHSSAGRIGSIGGKNINCLMQPRVTTDDAMPSISFFFLRTTCAADANRTQSK